MVMMTMMMMMMKIVMMMMMMTTTMDISMCPSRREEGVLPALYNNLKPCSPVDDEANWLFLYLALKTTRSSSPSETSTVDGLSLPQNLQPDAVCQQWQIRCTYVVT